MLTGVESVGGQVQLQELATSDAAPETEGTGEGTGSRRTIIRSVSNMLSESIIKLIYFQLGVIKKKNHLLL